MGVGGRLAPVYNEPTCLLFFRIWNPMPAAATTVQAVKPKSPLELLSEQTGLPLSYTKDLVKDLATDMLITILVTSQKRNDARGKELIGKAHVALKDLWPNSVFEDSYVHLTPPYLLLGIPGHGKTTVVREAHKLVANLMGFTPLDNPGSKDKIDENSYILMSVEFAGQNSAFSYKGMPIMRKDDEDEEAHMEYLRERLFSKMDVAAGGIMLMDDIGNANGALMNAALPMLEERRYNRTDMTKMHVTATGNLGALDGTKISGYSSALLGRARVVLTRDSAEDLALRIREKYGKDAIGDCFISNFIRSKGQDFIEQIPTAGGLATVPGPRTLEKAVVATRAELMKVGGPRHGVSALNPQSFGQNVGSQIGRAAADDLAAFLMSAYKHAEPAAEMVIQKGERHDVLNTHAADPLDQDSIMFYEQFAVSLANHAFLAIKRDGKSFDKIVKRFYDGMFEMQGGATQSSALSLFKERLTNELPEYSTAPSKGDNKRRVLNEDTYKRLTDILRDHPDSNKEDWNAHISILSEAGLYGIETAPVAAATGAAPRARNNVKKATGAPSP